MGHAQHWQRSRPQLSASAERLAPLQAKAAAEGAGGSGDPGPTPRGKPPLPAGCEGRVSCGAQTLSKYLPSMSAEPAFGVPMPPESIQMGSNGNATEERLSSAPRQSSEQARPEEAPCAPLSDRTQRTALAPGKETHCPTSQGWQHLPGVSVTGLSEQGEHTARVPSLLLGCRATSLPHYPRPSWSKEKGRIRGDGKQSPSLWPVPG